MHSIILNTIHLEVDCQKKILRIQIINLDNYGLRTNKYKPIYYKSLKCSKKTLKCIPFYLYCLLDRILFKRYTIIHTAYLSKYSVNKQRISMRLHEVSMKHVVVFLDNNGSTTSWSHDWHENSRPVVRTLIVF